MKKITAAILCLSMILGITACSESEPETSETSFDREREYWETVSDMQNEWEEGVLNDSVQKLIDSGALAAPEDEYQFAFRKDGSGYVLDFLDAGVEAQLTGDFSLVPENIILSRADRVYYKRYGGEICSVDSELPWFFPEFTDNSTVYHFASRPEIFADTMEECRYLIIQDSFISFREKDYYYGPMDRCTTTTMVFIIDAQKRELLHVEIIGSDTPPDGSSDHTNGRYKQEEADTYIYSLLGF